MEENEKTTRQSGGKVGAFFKRIFVHNIGWKLLALGVSALVWFLVAGLW